MRYDCDSVDKDRERGWANGVVDRISPPVRIGSLQSAG